MRYVLHLVRSTRYTYLYLTIWPMLKVGWKMCQMILFDLDGTLLTSDGIVSSTTADIIKFCKLKGLYIGFVTARSGAKKNIKLLDGLPCDFIAFYNGATVYAESQLIGRNDLPYKQATSILQRLGKDFLDVEIDVYQEPWFFSSARNEICHIVLGNREVCNLNKLPELDVQRIRLRSENLKSIPLEKYMTAESTFYYTVFGDVIIGHKSANKGNATKSASKYFCIPLTQIIAFGDDVNDIDMIKIVGTGIAMGNAVPGLKKVADYITETNDNNGIASWINKYLVK